VSAALIGDLEWLKKTCSNEIKRGSWQLTCLSGKEAGVHDIVSRSDAVILVTDQVSHSTRRTVVSAAVKRNIPVFMRHSSGAHLIPASLNEIGSTGMHITF